MDAKSRQLRFPERVKNNEIRWFEALDRVGIALKSHKRRSKNMFCRRIKRSLAAGGAREMRTAARSHYKLKVLNFIANTCELA